MARGHGAFPWDVHLVRAKASASQAWGSGCDTALAREAAAIPDRVVRSSHTVRTVARTFLWPEEKGVSCENCLFPLFFFFFLRCLCEALFHTIPAAWALKPERAYSKEMVFPIPPAGFRDFLLQSGSDFVGVCKEPWSVLCLVQGTGPQARGLMTGGQGSIVHPQSAGDRCRWLLVPSAIAASASASFMC